MEILRHKELLEELALGYIDSSRARVFTAFLGCLSGVLRRWLSLDSSAEPRGVAAPVRCADPIPSVDYIKKSQEQELSIRTRDLSLNQRPQLVSMRDTDSEAYL